MPVWTRIDTEAEFLARVADRPLRAKGMAFTLQSDGRITGTIDGRRLTGTWSWSDGCFCRTASLDEEVPDTDCERIEISGDRMRYTRRRGTGQTHVVTFY